PTQTIISWPVNNHWDTNFSPEQEGVITTTCYLKVHEQYDVAMANRFGMEQHRPLIAVPVKNNPLNRSLLSLDNTYVVVSALKVSEDNQALIVRLRSVSDKTETVTLGYPSGLPKSVFTSTVAEKPLEKNTGRLVLPPYGTVTLRMV